MQISAGRVLAAAIAALVLIALVGGVFFQTVSSSALAEFHGLRRETQALREKLEAYHAEVRADEIRTPNPAEDADSDQDPNQDAEPDHRSGGLSSRHGKGSFASWMAWFVHWNGGSD